MNEEIKELVMYAYKLGFYEGSLQVTNITYTEIIEKLNDPIVMSEITGESVNDESSTYDELNELYS